MNVVSSMLYFLGTKIQNLKSLATLDMAEPSANKMSTVICKNVANGGGQPQVVTVDVPSDKNALLGVSQAQNGTGCEPMTITLPLSVEYGGTGRTTASADDVIERTTSSVDGNTWYIEKWSSGVVKAKCITESEDFTINTSAGAGYYTSKTINLPEDVFKEITFADANRCLGNAATNIIFGSVRNATKEGDYYKNINTWLWTAQSVSGVSISIGVQIEGTWK